MLLIRSLAILLTGAAAYAAAPRIETTINRDWTFQYFPAPDQDARTPAQPAFDDGKWPAIALPHTWSTFETTGELHPFIRSANERMDTYWWYGWGWYRKHITIGRQYQDRLVALEFDGVQKYSRIYVNGVLAGEHRGGYTSFSIDITPHVKFGAENLIAVQVSNRRDDSGRIPPMTAGNFDVYGGIYRDVRLVIRDRLHVPFQGSAESEGGTFVTTPFVNEKQGTVQVRTWVRNDYGDARLCTLVTAVRDETGNVVAQQTAREAIQPGELHEFTQQIGPVANPHLWAPETPYLYRVSTEVRDGVSLADTYESPLGFRWFHWNHAEERLYLNGKPILLRGINRHQEYPWLGDAMPKWMHLKDLEDIRFNMGLNFQRTAHYPQDPYVYDQCDRLGFILIEEVPNIKDLPFSRDVQRVMVQEMIRRDRNHPSIFIWSMGNETNRPADSAWAHNEDTSRIIYLRRGENGGDFVQLTDKDLPIENLLRCTVRGWYSEDDRDFGPATRNPASGQITGTESWQHHSDATSGPLSEENVVVFLYADHGADREYLNSPVLHVNPKGWTDAYRFPKYVYYLWQANFTVSPMAFILPHYWREQYIGQRKPIVVDSNCDQVTLKVNGEPIGTAQPSHANNHSVTFENVEIRRGTISVEGIKDGQRITYSQAMADKAARLLLRSSEQNIPADRSGIAVLKADIVDATGVHVYGAHPPLTWALSGPAKLVGPAVYTSDTDKKEAIEGTMYIDAPAANLVRSTATPGTIRVRVSAPGLESAEVQIVSTAPEVMHLAGIDQPPLSDAGRHPIARLAGFQTITAAPKPSSRNQIAEISKDYDFQTGSRDRLQPQIEAFVQERNPRLATSTSDYRDFIDRMTTLVFERYGHLVADDYNFYAQSLGSRKPDAREEARRRIRSTLFVPNPLPPLDTQTYGEFEPAPGVIAERVSYATAYGLRVPAIVYRPKQRPAVKMPGLLVVNGHGGDKYSWYSFYSGILYAQAGAVVVTYDPIGEGERNSQRKNGTRQHDRNVDPPEMGRRMGGLMMTDVMQAVSYLASRPDVDSKKLAALGYSMGSFVLGLACAAETRLNACVLAGGGNLDGDGGYWDTSSKKMCQAIPYQAMKLLGDRGPALYDLHAARGATFILNGADDDVVAIPQMGPQFFEDLRKRTVALHGSDTNVFTYAFVPSAGHRPYFLTRQAAEWLERRLRFPNWTQESIARMQETHISEWAARNQVMIDRLYATELREGGTMALGTGIPALPHDQLNALPLERWERDKEEYIYETWLKRAEGSIR